MAKVKDFDEIDLSSLDGNDLFYVIDYRTADDPNPKSKKITYSRLTYDLNSNVGLNSLLTADTFKSGDKTYLCMVFELKNGSQKTLCVDVGYLIDVYRGDGTTISVDSNNNIKVIASYLSSTTKLSEIESNEIQKYQLKSELSNKLALSSLNDLQGYNIVYDQENKRLSAQYYIHPTHESHASGLYKITVDSMGHVTSAISVQKSDITNLGIPGQDTTYSAGNGLKLEGTSFSVSADYALTSDLSTYGGSDSISVGGDGTSKTVNVKVDVNGHIAITDSGLSVGDYIVHNDVENKLALSSRDQLNIPTKVSDLTNDSGFISSHQQLKTINNIAISGSGNLDFLSSDTQFITINGISVKGSDSLELLSSYDYSTISSGIGLGNYALTSSLSTYGGSDSISVGGDGTSKTIDVKLNPNGNIVSTKEGLSVKESIGKEYLFNSNGFQTTTDKKTPSQISVSLKLGSNLTFDSDGKLSAGSGGSTYSSGSGISIDNGNKINIAVADDGKLSFSDNKLSVGDFISQVTFISWFES